MTSCSVLSITKSALLPFERTAPTNTKERFVYTLACSLPWGLTIGKSIHGLGLFATAKFAKGQVLYTGSHIVIQDFGGGKVLLKTNIGSFVLETKKHGSLQPDGICHIYTFDAFTNHCCSPNTYSADERCDEAGGTYKTVALRDISPGEEITCDYDLYEYDAKQMAIAECRCGSACCRGRALGFMHWPEELQIPMLPRLEETLLGHWRAAHPRVLLRSVAAPAGVGIVRLADDSLTLVATRSFSPGEVVMRVRLYAITDRSCALESPASFRSS